MSKLKIGIPFLTVAMLVLLVPNAHATPCLNVTKQCQDSVAAGEPITFNGIVTNCGTIYSLVVTVDDDHAGRVLGPVTLAPGESAPYSGSYVPQTSPSTNVVTATGAYVNVYDGKTYTIKSYASATCEAATGGCRVTFGGNATAGLAADGLTWDGTFAEAKTGSGRNGINRYTFGGQVGARSALSDPPSGELTHTNHSGPAGRFTFHAGTASAPDETEISQIICSDPGTCRPSGDPPSPARQIDFTGVGTFKNMDSAALSLAGAIPGETFHAFDVHMEDLGEPGGLLQGVDKKNMICPGGGSGTDAFALPPVFLPAYCGCADYYRIRIYGAYDPSVEAPDKSTIIYEVGSYINGGNLQIHYLTGFDLK